jgi:hypothetical protein
MNLLTKQARWQAELMVSETANRRDIEGGLAMLAELAASVNRLSPIAEQIPELMAREREAFLGTLQQERSEVLSDIERQRLETMSFLTRERSTIIDDIKSERQALVETLNRNAQRYYNRSMRSAWPRYLNLNPPAIAC